jgi:hypothetical protein
VIITRYRNVAHQSPSGTAPYPRTPQPSTAPLRKLRNAHKLHVYFVPCRQPQTSASCGRSQWRSTTPCCTSPHVKVSCRKLSNGNQPATCMVAAGKRAAAICSNKPFKVQWLLYAPLVETAFCSHRGFVALFCIVPTKTSQNACTTLTGWSV